MKSTIISVLTLTMLFGLVFNFNNLSGNEVTVPTPTETIEDLSVLSEFSEASPQEFPVPVADEFDLNDTRARKYTKTNKHGSYENSVINATNGKFTISFRAKLDSSKGVLCGQIKRAKKNKDWKKEFVIEMTNDHKLEATAWDTSDSDNKKRLHTKTDDLSATYDLTKYHTITVVFDVLNDNAASITVYLDGTNVSGVSKLNHRHNGGIADFSGGSLQPEFSIGNTGSDSYSFDGADVTLARFRIWDGTALTASQVQQDISNEDNVITNKNNGSNDPVYPRKRHRHCLISN